MVATMALRQRQEEQLQQAVLLYLQPRYPRAAQAFKEEAQIQPRPSAASAGGGGGGGSRVGGRGGEGAPIDEDALLHRWAATARLQAKVTQLQQQVQQQRDQLALLMASTPSMSLLTPPPPHSPHPPPPPHHHHPSGAAAASSGAAAVAASSIRRRSHSGHLHAAAEGDTGRGGERGGDTHKKRDDSDNKREVITSDGDGGGDYHGGEVEKNEQKEKEEEEATTATTTDMVNDSNTIVNEEGGGGVAAAGLHPPPLSPPSSSSSSSSSLASSYPEAIPSGGGTGSGVGDGDGGATATSSTSTATGGDTAAPSATAAAAEGRGRGDGGGGNRKGRGGPSAAVTAALEYAKQEEVLQAENFGLPAAPALYQLPVSRRLPINALAVHPLLPQVVTASDDGSLRVYQLQEGGGRLLKELPVHREAVHDVVFDTSGRWCGSGSSDCTIRILDVQQNYASYRILQGHHDAVSRVQFCILSRPGSSSSSTFLFDNFSSSPATAGFGDPLQQTTSGAHLSMMSGAGGIGIGGGGIIGSHHHHSSSSSYGSLNPHSSLFLASCGRDGTIRLWSVAAGLCVRTFTATSMAPSLSYDSSSSSTSSSGSTSNRERMQHAGGGIDIYQIGRGGGAGSSARGGDVATTGGGSGSGAASTTERTRIAGGVGHFGGGGGGGGFGGGFGGVGGSGGATATTGGQQHAYGRDGAWVRGVALPEEALRAAKVFATCGNDSRVVIWRYDLGVAIRDLLLHHNHVVEDILFASERTLRLLYAHHQAPPPLPSTLLDEAALEAAEEELHGDKHVLRMAGIVLFSASRDSTIKMADVAQGTILHTFVGHVNWVRRISLHPAGTHMISCGDDRSIRCWNVVSGACERVLSAAHSQFVTCLGFSSTAMRLFASGSLDGTVKVWRCSIEQPQDVYAHI